MMTIHEPVFFQHSILDLVLDKDWDKLDELIQEGAFRMELVTQAKAVARTITLNKTVEATINLDGVEKMKNTVTELKDNVVNDTLTVAEIQTGRLLYRGAVSILAPMLPTLKWYEKLFMSKAKQDMATMLAVYVLIHLVRTKYDHYSFEAITKYLNFEFQSSLVNVSGGELAKLFKLPTKV